MNIVFTFPIIYIIQHVSITSKIRKFKWRTFTLFSFSYVSCTRTLELYRRFPFQLPPSWFRSYTHKNWDRVDIRIWCFSKVATSWVLFEQFSSYKYIRYRCINSSNELSGKLKIRFGVRRWNKIFARYLSASIHRHFSIFCWIYSPSAGSVSMFFKTEN